MEDALEFRRRHFRVAWSNQAMTVKRGGKWADGSLLIPLAKTNCPS